MVFLLPPLLSPPAIPFQSLWLIFLSLHNPWKAAFFFLHFTHDLTHSYRTSVISQLLIRKSVLLVLTPLFHYSSFLPLVVSRVLTSISDCGHVRAGFYFILVLLRAETENYSKQFMKQKLHQSWTSRSGSAFKKAVRLEGRVFKFADPLLMSHNNMT